MKKALLRYGGRCSALMGGVNYRRAMRWGARLGGGLFGDHFKFRSGGVVASVLCVEGHEADVAAFDGAGEGDCLLRCAFVECAFGYGLAPLAAVGADVDFVVFDCAGGVAVLAREVVDAFDGLRFSGVEVDPVGVGCYGDGIHGVPDGGRVAVGEVGGFAVVGFLAAGVGGLCGDGLDARECHRCVDGGGVLEPCLDGAALFEGEWGCVEARPARCAVGVEDFGRGVGRRDGELA